jgi:hypothetical protein
MPSSKPHKYILQARLPRGEVLQFASLLFDGVKQRGDR